MPAGALNISFSALFNDEYRDIWLNIRLPRVLLAVLVGAALATAGVIMQDFSQSNGRSRPAWRQQRLRADGRHRDSYPIFIPVVLVLYEQMILPSRAAWWSARLFS